MLIAYHSHDLLNNILFCFTFPLFLSRQKLNKIKKYFSREIIRLKVKINKILFEIGTDPNLFAIKEHIKVLYIYEK